MIAGGTLASTVHDKKPAAAEEAEMTANDPAEMERSERRGLLLSVYGALFMGALGIGFALLTGSQAVLLDGLFSLIGFAVSLVAMRVATLVRRPDDERFHFGYAAYEPMLNLSKGLLMLLVSLFAAAAAVVAILAGGREVRGGIAVIYALIAAAGCFVIALVQPVSYTHLRAHET